MSHSSCIQEDDADVRNDDPIAVKQKSLECSYFHSLLVVCQLVASVQIC